MLVLPSLISKRNLLEETHEQEPDVFDFKIERTQNQNFENDFEKKLNDCRSNIKNLRKEIGEDYNDIDITSEEIKKCEMGVESRSTMIKLAELTERKIYDRMSSLYPVSKNTNHKNSAFLSQVMSNEDREKRQSIVVSNNIKLMLIIIIY